MNYLWIIRYEIVKRFCASRKNKNFPFVFLLLINIIQIEFVLIEGIIIMNFLERILYNDEIKSNDIMN